MNFKVYETFLVQVIKDFYFLFFGESVYKIVNKKVDFLLILRFQCNYERISIEGVFFEH